MHNIKAHYDLILLLIQESILTIVDDNENLKRLGPVLQMPEMQPFTLSLVVKRLIIYIYCEHYCFVSSMPCIGLISPFTSANMHDIKQFMRL